jgi:hypothetical protein
MIMLLFLIMCIPSKSLIMGLAIFGQQHRSGPMIDKSRPKFQHVIVLPTPGACRVIWRAQHCPDSPRVLVLLRCNLYARNEKAIWSVPERKVQPLRSGCRCEAPETGKSHDCAKQSMTAADRDIVFWKKEHL